MRLLSFITLFLLAFSCGVRESTMKDCAQTCNNNVKFVTDQVCECK